ncbi:hypothetical protein RV02_GL002423 [Enterococcus gilvus]|nr:hypothetical protein RV02_GL002423 [Enterococcus gilvus]
MEWASSALQAYSFERMGLYEKWTSNKTARIWRYYKIVKEF